jgi:glycosyltransferase involved in cell wall biosynthesis
MKITFLVERPTQFEAPFFRHAAADPAHQLRVLFTGADPAEPVFDPELGHPVSWGMDLLGGYPHAVAPAAGRRRWLAGQLRRGSCDLLIANGYTRRDYLLAAWQARRAGIATALRLDSVIWEDDGDDGDIARRRLKRLLFAGFLLHLFDLFLGVGSGTLDYLAACGVPAARCGLFPYAVDVEHFRAGARRGAAAREAARRRLGIPAAARVVLAVAKLNPREAPWDLLRALPALPPETWLLIAGDGPQRGEMERLAGEMAGGVATGGSRGNGESAGNEGRAGNGKSAQRAGPVGQVRFLGYVPYAELPALYAVADLFVHAAQEERWGVSVAEAMACGLPVVASSRVGAGRDLVAPGRNGWSYRVGDAAELAQRAGAALALDRGAVAAANREILSHWDYAASWRHLLDAGGRIVRGSAA